MNRKQTFSWGVMGVAVFAVRIMAQPEAPLTGPNYACASGPTLSDTLSLPSDDSGFTSIFDGKSLHGFWESCQSSHSSADRTYGGIWLVDSVNHLLFSTQNTNGAGSILMTNKSYGNYELILDLWPSFGDDGGVFNRTTAAGSCYQTTMDYLQGSSVGGTYFEGGYTGTSRNYDPYVFAANKYTVTIGTNSNSTNNWTYVTKTFSDPTSYGCPSTGCTPANWTTVWDTGGWNQVRVKFYGTGASASNKVHNYAWIRRLGASVWTPTILDSEQYNTPASYLGFQIHGGSANWSNRNGHWMRNIKIRPLTDQGVPIIATSPIASHTPSIRQKIRATSSALVGSLDLDHVITVSDLSGRVLERFSGRAGTFHYAFTNREHGLLFLEVKTARGTDHLRVARISE